MKNTAAQAGALPYRYSAAGLEVLLVTSLTTGRWIIPKGNVPKNMQPPRAAEREAHEEAGVIGRLLDRKLSSYLYDKRENDGSIRPMRVKVFGLEVARQLKSWPEQGKRLVRWVGIPEAIELISDRGMVLILQDFAEAHEAGAAAAR